MVLCKTMIFLILLGSTLNTAHFEEDGNNTVRYNGSQIWKVTLSDDTDYHVIMKMTKELGVRLWSGSKKAMDIHVYPERKEEVSRRLEENSLTYSVLIEDIQRLIDFERMSLDEMINATLTGRAIVPVSYEAALSLSNIYKYLDSLNMEHPFCRVHEIGYSSEGIPLKVLQISRGVAITSAWIMSGLSSREWHSLTTVLHIIDYLINYGMSKNNDILDVDFYFLVISNPDGYQYTLETDRLWIKNRRPTNKCFGVNLSRNFRYRFKKTTNDTCSDIYGGETPFSEPETIAIRDFFKKSAANFSIFLDIHSYGSRIMFPWAYKVATTKDFRDLYRAANTAAVAIHNLTGQNYVVGSIGTVQQTYTGSSIDWAKAELKIKYCFLIELKAPDGNGYLATIPNVIPRDGLEAFKTIIEEALPITHFLHKLSNANKTVVSVDSKIIIVYSVLFFYTINYNFH